MKKDDFFGLKADLQTEPTYGKVFSRLLVRRNWDWKYEKPNF